MGRGERGRRRAGCSGLAAGHQIGRRHPGRRIGPRRRAPRTAALRPSPSPPTSHAALRRNSPMRAGLLSSGTRPAFLPGAGRPRPIQRRLLPVCTGGHPPFSAPFCGFDRGGAQALPRVLCTAPRPRDDPPGKEIRLALSDLRGKVRVGKYVQCFEVAFNNLLRLFDCRSAGKYPPHGSTLDVHLARADKVVKHAVKRPAGYSPRQGL